MSKVKVTSDGTWAGTHIMIGGEELAATAMELVANHGILSLRLETLIDLADIEMNDFGKTELVIKHMAGGKDKRVGL